MIKSVLQFKIILEDTHPVVWRRIQILASASLWDLHIAIQNAMGWTNSHLHDFVITALKTNKVEYFGIPDPEMDRVQVLPDWEYPVLLYVQPEDYRIRYRYDFGDDWQHELIFEGIYAGHLSKYPICVAGDAACPPEDVGGTEGYRRFIDAIQDPRHEAHQDLLSWVGGKFDFRTFNLRMVKFENPKMRLKDLFSDV
jgi:hypothetical protein